MILKINHKPARIPYPSRGPALVVGGPKEDPLRNELFFDFIKNHPGVPLMCVNNTYEFIDADWNYFCTLDSYITSLGHYYILDMIPKSTHVIGYDTGTVHPRVDEVLHIDPSQGTSGLFATVAAVYKGYNPVLTLGLYMDEPPYNGTNVKVTWYQWKPFLEGKVKSLTDRGLVAEMLGIYK